MSAIKVDIHVLLHGEGLPLPGLVRALHVAGLDLSRRFRKTRRWFSLPGKHALVPTGLAIALPEGFEAQVRPRSALRQSMASPCWNSPGTIDAGLSRRDLP